MLQDHANNLVSEVTLHKTPVGPTRHSWRNDLCPYDMCPYEACCSTYEMQKLSQHKKEFNLPLWQIFAKTQQVHLIASFTSISSSDLQVVEIQKKTSLQNFNKDLTSAHNSNQTSHKQTTQVHQSHAAFLNQTCLA